MSEYIYTNNIIVKHENVDHFTKALISQAKSMYNIEVKESDFSKEKRDEETLVLSFATKVDKEKYIEIYGEIEQDDNEE